jgi:hypothetical protein
MRTQPGSANLRIGGREGNPPIGDWRSEDYFAPALAARALPSDITA